jgi:hypothetical protein
MAVLVPILFVLLIAGSLWWAPFAGWKPRVGRDPGGRLWKLDLILMVILLIVMAIGLGVRPSPGMMAAILLVAAVAAFGIEALRNRNARRRKAESNNVGSL